MKSGDVLAGRFEVDVLAGEGGMGRVYRAYDRLRQTFVAIKVLAADSAKHAARFEREANTLADLSSTNIVRHLERGTTDGGVPFFVMDWLDGEDLSQRIARGALTLEETLAVITGTATALAAAHAKRIIHRDVKPSNIFLLNKQFEHIRLLDFGIAKNANNAVVTTMGSIMGTPAYMAPELAHEGFVPDARADIFSLGCVFYECLTRRPAFAGANWLSVVAKILTTNPPRLREVRPEMPAEIEALVMRMMAKEPRHRPPDAAAVLHELEQLGTAYTLGTHAANAMTNFERRNFSLLFARCRTDRVPTPDTTLADDEADQAGAWQRAATTWGGRLMVLPDGMVMIAMNDANVATDNAARAARCALWLRANANAKAIALTTWTGPTDGNVTPTNAIDQAALSLLSDVEMSDSCPIGIDETTAHLLNARFLIREVGAGALLIDERGDILGARRLLGKSTPCIGRESELATLVHSWVACLDEQAASASLVSGAAGTGKSRIVQEFVSRVNDRNEAVTIWIGRADALRTGSTLGLLAQIVKQACGIRSDEPLAEGRRKVALRVQCHVEVSEQQRITEFLCEMIGLPCSEETSILLRAARRHAPTMADEMLRAWLDFLRAECNARPHLLILEDLHWADEATLRFIDAGLVQVSERPWMVVATARQELRDRFPKLWSARHLREITLQPLRKKACERLTRHVLGDHIDPAALERIVTRADGNAFYLEELIRHTAAQKNDELPPSVVAMVQSRLALLDEQDRRTIRAAAIFGEAFGASALAALLGGASHTPTTSQQLHGLVNHEVFVKQTQSRFADEPEFAFRHVILREAAYAMLTDRDRTVGHKLAGEWLETHGEVDPALLAKHFEEAQEGERAASYYMRATELALEAGDYRASIDFAQRGVSLTRNDDTLAGLRAVEAVAGLWSGQLSQALIAANETLRVARSGSKEEGFALHAGLLSAMYLRQLDTLDENARLLMAAHPNREALAFIAMAFMSLISALAWSAKRDSLESCMQRFEELMAPFLHEDPVATAQLELTRGVVALYIHHNPWGFMDHSRRAVEWHAKTGSSRELPLARVNMASGYWLLGLFDQAEREFALIMPKAAPLDALFARFTQARMRIEQGQLDEAERTIDLCSHEFEMLGETMVRADSRLSWVDVQLRRGNLDAAVAEMDRLGFIHSEPYIGQWGWTQLARIRLLQGRAQEACALAARAYEQSLTYGMGYCTSHAQLLHLRAEAMLACGNVEAAHEALRVARDDLSRRTLLIPDPAARKAFLTNLDVHRRTVALVQQCFEENLLVTTGASLD